MIQGSQALSPQILMILSHNNVKGRLFFGKKKILFSLLTNWEIPFVRGEAQTLTENAQDAGIVVQQALEEHCQHQQVVGRVGVHKVTEIVPAKKKKKKNYGRLM